jgi:hypothetical protein
MQAVQVRRQITRPVNKQSRFENGLSNLIVDLRLWSESLREGMKIHYLTCTIYYRHTKDVGVISAVIMSLFVSARSVKSN